MVEEGAKPITDYRDLNVWNESMSLAVDVFSVTRTFPREELFGLSAQMRRAAGSIPANIAEGFGREQTRSFVQFLRVSQGSLKELETHILLAERVLLLEESASAALMRKCASIGKMLRSLIRALDRRTPRA
jgi:four helix bundle protein